jgi:hypothetical protein
MTGWKNLSTDYIAQTGAGRQIRQSEGRPDLVPQRTASLSGVDLNAAMDASARSEISAILKQDAGSIRLG